MNTLRERIERDFLPFVEKPLRYTGSEINVIRKDPATVTLHGVLCFPDLYDIGMSHLGLQILYHIVNKERSWALSRCFQPWSDAETLMRKHDLPLWSLEYFSPIGEADWIGFSLQYELHYTNMLAMLDLGGIPLWHRERRERDPIVIAGGPCMGNPEPIAEFADIVVVGDGEEAIQAICRRLEEKKKAGASRLQTIEALAEIPGVYAPSIYKTEKSSRFIVSRPAAGNPVRATKIPVLADENYPEKPIVPIIDVVHHRLAVEVMRGCTRGCRFCAAGTYYRPVRERAVDSLAGEIERGVATTGWRDIGLLSLSSADYSCMNELLDSALSIKRRYRAAFSLPSTRVDALSGEQFDRLTAVTAITSVTIAPEAGSQRLRRVINKDFSDETIYAAVKTLFDRNVQTVKLYFMIGLPTETAEDIDAIIAMIETISRMASGASQRRAVNVSISPFSPKANTPFQWEAMEAMASLDEKSRYLKKSVRHLRNVKLSYRNVAMTFLETLMARGDRAMAKVIFEAFRLGARFDGWEEKFDLARWLTAAANAGVDLPVYLDPIPLDQELPWQGIDTGVAIDFLKRERERARAGEGTGDCRTGACVVCGACAPGQQPLLATGSAKGSSGQTQVIVDTTEPRPGVKENVTLYRFIYSKGPAVRFLGHLDMMAVFQRAFIAAGFVLQYSHGYQPHPKVSFGPPLPFGALGDAEAFDLSALEPLGDDPLRINGLLPGDLRAVSCTRIYEGGPSLNVVIKAAEYAIIPGDEIDKTVLSQAVDRVAAQQSVPVTVTKNGVLKNKDLRPLILELGIDEQDGRACVRAVLSLEPAATCKPSELVSALFPERSFSAFLVIRKRCLVKTAGRLTDLNRPADRRK